MLWKNSILGCAIGLALLTGLAQAAFSVKINGEPCADCVTPLGSNHYDVYVTATDETVEVTGGAGDVVETIAIVCAGTNQTVLLSVSGVLDVYDIFRITNSEGELNVTSVSATYVGNVSANTIGSITAATEVYGQILQQASELVDSSTDGITLVRSVNGDITGDISATRRIVEIRASNGAIGASGSHSSIYSTKSIGAITGEAVYSDINIIGGAADLDTLRVTDGDFVGSLSCRKVTGSGAVNAAYGLEVVQGDLDANLTHDTTAMNTGFRVGGSFASGKFIKLPASGLTKQIIFGGTGTGSWSGDVKLNNVALTGQPYYTNTASSVGGGAAGLAAFNLHDESCNPTNGNTAVVGRRAAFTCEGEEDCCLVFSKAVIRMYGPVSLHATLPSVTVKKWNGSSYAAVGWTSTTVHPASGDHREVEVKRVNGVWDLGDYLIEPIAGKMACEDVDGNPDIATYADFNYMFSLVDACGEDSFVQGGYDRNSDGHITAADITAWVAAQCDLTNDGQITVADLARLMRIVARFN